MKARVQLIYDCGRALSTQERKQSATYRGSLRVHEIRSNQLGRTSITAQLVSATDAVQVELLPELRDATLTYVFDGRLRVTGVETRNHVVYSQTWDVRLLP